MDLFFVCGKLAGNTKVDVLAHAQMGKETRLLGEIPNRSLVQRKRWRKELEVPQRHATVIRFLYAGNARKHRAFARAGSPEQPYRTSSFQLQRDIYVKFATLLNDVGFKHGVVAAPVHGPAREAAEQP